MRGLGRVARQPDGSLCDSAALEAYDLQVLGLANTRLWRCPTEVLLEQYDHNVRTVHLDVGPGSGYFLDHCRFPASSPSVTLLDRNPVSLAYAARRIARYRPATTLADICAPISEPGRRFSSIGFNYVLHCVPRQGGLRAAAMHNLRMLLADDGVLFGSTILGRETVHTPVSRRVNQRLNRTGAFDNLDDGPETVESLLRAEFGNCELRVAGSVALFTASGLRTRNRKGRSNSSGRRLVAVP